MFNPLCLAKRTILVTGASSGIGRATALYLSRLEARLVLVARNRERLEETRGLLESPDGVSTGGRTMPHIVAPYDLMDYEGIPDWLRMIATESGPIQGMVHGAGVHFLSPLQILDGKKLEAMMRVNYYAGIYLLKGLRQKGVAQRPASAVFVTSVMAHVGQAAVSAYAGSKSALTAASRALALELAADGIRVNCVAPGHTDSEMAQRQQQRMTSAQLQHLTEAHPLGLGQPDDVAGAVAFLLSDAARWVTGATLTVDGGYSVH